MARQNLFSFEYVLLKNALERKLGSGVMTGAVSVDEVTDLMKGVGSTDDGFAVVPLVEEYNAAVNEFIATKEDLELKLQNSKILSWNDINPLEPMVTVGEGAYVVFQQNGTNCGDCGKEKFLVAHIYDESLGLMNIETDLGRALLGKKAGEVAVTNINRERVTTNIIEVSCGYHVKQLEFDLVHGIGNHLAMLRVIKEDFSLIAGHGGEWPGLEEYIAADTKGRIEIRELEKLPNQLIPIYRRAAILSEYTQ